MSHQTSTDPTTSLQQIAFQAHQHTDDLLHRQTRREAWEKCLEFLKAYEPAPTFSLARFMKASRFIPQVLKAICDDEKWQKFLRGDGRRILWILGRTGAGKTSLFLYLLQMFIPTCKLNNPEGGDHALAYFLCHEGVPGATTGIGVLSGLILSLSRQYPHLMNLMVNAYLIKGKALFAKKDTFDNLWAIFVSFLRGAAVNGPVVVAIDSLDECGQDRSRLIGLINSLVPRTPNVRWLLSCRRLSVEKVPRHASLIQLNTAMMTRLTGEYIRLLVADVVKNKGLDGETNEIISRTLAEKCDNTLLWVGLTAKVLQQLEFAQNEQARRFMQHLPAGIDGIYCYELGQIELRAQNCPGVFDRLLATVTITTAPLSLQELALVADVPPNVQSNMTAVVESCAPFLKNIDGLVYIPHHSARVFLMNSQFVFPQGLEGGHFRVFAGLLNSMAKKLTRGMARPNSTTNEAGESSDEQSNPLDLIKYACLNWIPHALEIKETLATTVMSHAAAFLSQRLLNWIEAVYLLRGSQKILEQLRDLFEVTSHQYINEALNSVVADTYHFFLYYGRKLKRNPQKIYTSILASIFAGSVESMRAATKPQADHSWTTGLVKFASEEAGVCTTESSSDDNEFADLSEDDQVQVCDSATGGELAQICMPQVEGSDAVVFSNPSVQMVATGTDCNIRLWDVASGRLIQTFRHDSPVYHVVLYGEGRMIACILKDEKNKEFIELWIRDVRTGAAVYKALEPVGDVVSAVAVNSKIRLALASKGRAEIMDASVTPDGQEIYCSTAMQLEGRYMDSGVMSPDGRLFASLILEGGNYAKIELWDISRREISQTLIDYDSGSGDVNEALIEFSPNSRVFASSLDRTCGIIKIWDIFEGHCFQAIHIYEVLTRICFLPNNQKLAAILQDGRVKTRELVVGPSPISCTSQHEDVVTSVAFFARGDLVVTTSEDCTAKIWDTREGSCLQTIQGHTAPVLSAALSTNSEFITSISRNGQIIRSSVKTGQRAQYWDVQTELEEGEHAISADGEIVAFCFNSNIHVLNVAAGFVCAVINTKASTTITRVAFSPDGRYIASVSGNDDVCTWDVDTGNLVARMMSVAPPSDDSGNDGGDALLGESDHSLLYSADGKILVGALRSGDIHIWDAVSGHLLKKIYSVFAKSLGLSCLDNSLLCTNMGTLNVSLSNLDALPAEAEMRKDCTYQGVHLNENASHLLENDCPVMWFHGGNMKSKSVARDSVVVLGLDSGTVSIMRFDNDKMDQTMDP